MVTFSSVCVIAFLSTPVSCLGLVIKVMYKMGKTRCDIYSRYLHLNMLNSLEHGNICLNLPICQVNKNIGTHD